MEKNKTRRRIMNKEQNRKEGNAHILFNVMTILLLIYMVYTIFMTYSQLSSYCEQYNTTMMAQWSYCLLAMTAAVVPCLVYACTCYGIGIIIKNQQTNISKK